MRRIPLRRRSPLHARQSYLPGYHPSSGQPADIPEIHVDFTQRRDVASVPPADPDIPGDTAPVQPPQPAAFGEDVPDVPYGVDPEAVAGGEDPADQASKIQDPSDWPDELDSVGYMTTREKAPAAFGWDPWTDRVRVRLPDPPEAAGTLFEADAYFGPYGRRGGAA